jgi:hypothetical protein
MRQTPFVGAPFASFIDQSSRIAGRALADRPIRLLSLAAMPYALSYMSALLLGIRPEEKELLDSDRSYWEPLLPFRDEQGRVMTLDLRYIMPLANDIVPEMRGNAIIRVPWFMADPVGQAIIEQMFGRDMYTGRSFVPMSEKATDKEIAGARAKQAAKTLVPHPTLLSYGLKRLKDSATGERDEPLARAILGTILGVNIRAPYINEKHVRTVAKNAVEEGDNKLAETILDLWNNTYKPPYLEKLTIESVGRGLKQSKSLERTKAREDAAERLLRKDTAGASKIIADYNASLTSPDDKFYYSLTLQDAEAQAGTFTEKGKTR